MEEMILPRPCKAIATEPRNFKGYSAGGHSKGASHRSARNTIHFVCSVCRNQSHRHTRFSGVTTRKTRNRLKSMVTSTEHSCAVGVDPSRQVQRTPSKHKSPGRATERVYHNHPRFHSKTVARSNWEYWVSVLRAKRSTTSHPSAAQTSARGQDHPRPS